MSIEKMIMSKAVKLYLLDMINMEYIDLDKSYITHSGTVLFKIDTDKLPELTIENETVSPRKILESAIFDFAYNYKYATDRLRCVALGKKTECVRKILPDKTDEYYIPFVVSPVGTEHLPTVFVRHKGVMMSPPDDFITETMNLLKDSEAPEYDCYKNLISNFAAKANEWAREQICKKLIDGKIDGEFQQDLIKDNVYFNRRIVGDKSVTYIINDWFAHYAKGYVKFVDIDNGEKLMYVALKEVCA